MFSQLNLESFKSYAFQKSVLMFHTRISLKTFLETAGFKNIIIQGVQRYPLSNHLYWLSKGEPGGHNIWSHLRNPELDSAYLNLLSSLDQTDTLIAIAEV